ncbi:hypothetical protein MmTuc01_1164 [Methanosarcina mazei Tuc01]|jgi:hypothetical protein|uniref:Uncharacterized protein n=1 Tax=Methanosarcina mazei Tuc01 TaxID=1236903 RepID=M1Q8P1_METMZ|nr:hypothetical protein MmTuc01_1164 [Methanosarcina mazei Tuc01]
MQVIYPKQIPDPNGFLLQILTSGQRYVEKPIDIQALNDD